MKSDDRDALLEILKKPEQDAFSLIQKWAAIQNYIQERDLTSPSLRRIHFFSFELADTCQHHQPLLKYELIRDFFFDKKGFHIRLRDLSHWKELTLENFLDTRAGTDFMIGLTFRSLLLTGSLESHFVFLGPFLCLKLVIEGHCYYLDLHHRGLILEDHQMLERLALSRESPAQDLEPLSPEKILSLGLETLEKKFTTIQCQNFLLKVHELQVQLGHNPVFHLIKMAETKVNMGLRKEALGDLKRVMSLCLEKNIPPKTRLLYDQLRSEIEGHSSTPLFLH